MKCLLPRFLQLTALGACIAIASPAIAQDKPTAKAEASATKKEPVSLFDGKTLKGWAGLTENWSVEDGAITGENKAAAPIQNNTFLVYERPVADFEFRCEFKITGGNSGIQYRSKLIDKDKFIVGGYQADIDSQKRFMGINYEELGRGILAERGEIINLAKDGQKSRVGSTGDADALISKVNVDGWNQYRIVARGNKLQHFINDVLMSEVNDDQSDKSAKEGILALQLHAGPPMKIQFKNLYLSE